MAVCSQSSKSLLNDFYDSSRKPKLPVAAVEETVEMRILLIDDSTMLRRIHEKALVKAGYEVTSAGDGEEGLRVAREDNPDLILLDIMLPKIAGQDVLRTLKRDPRTRQIPVVVLSGLSQTNAAKLMAQGAVGFVEKTAEILENNSQSVVEAVQGVLSKTNQLKEIGWH
jgi:CheY-like chemotaxis protein